MFLGVKYVHKHIYIYIYIDIHMVAPAPVNHIFGLEISGAWAAVRVSVLQGKIASVLCDY